MTDIPVLTEDIIYGYDMSDWSVIPINVSDIGIIERRVDPMKLEPEIFETYPSYLYIGLKNSSGSSIYSEAIYEEKFWSELREFALRKGISYVIKAKVFPEPTGYRGEFWWGPFTPVFCPQINNDYAVLGLSHEFTLYAEYRSLAGQTDSIKVPRYFFGEDLIHQFLLINKTKQLIPELTEKEFKRLFNQKDDGEIYTREVKE